MLWLQYQNMRDFLLAKNVDLSDEEAVKQGIHRNNVNIEQMEKDTERLKEEGERMDKRNAESKQRIAELEKRRLERNLMNNTTVNAANSSSSEHSSERGPASNAKPTAVPMNCTDHQVETLILDLSLLIRGFFANIQENQSGPNVKVDREPEPAAHSNWLTLILLLLQPVWFIIFVITQMMHRRVAKVKAAQATVHDVVRRGPAHITLQILSQLINCHPKLFGHIRLRGAGRTKAQIIREMEMCIRVVLNFV